VRVSESFVVQRRRVDVWEVVGDVARVTRCLPGVDNVSIVDDENTSVRVTQSLGPMTATFQAKMKVTSREPGRLIRFSATGRSIRGAAGDVRLTNSVRLEDAGDGATRVVLEADVAMGGMLGAVGSKVIARQASGAAREFAAALERELTSLAHLADTAPGHALPEGRVFGAEFLELRDAALEWIEPYYDGEHLRRAADWLLVLDPTAPEPLILAALLHDMERDVPGGPVLDKRRGRWDDEEYNRLHCERSVAVVGGWLRGRRASQLFVDGIQPIREHEFGGSPAGDLLQAADSLSWLEVNAPLAARWVERGDCDVEKAREKLRWMSERVRLQSAQPIAAARLADALANLEVRVGAKS
jgi:uncharacterized protein